MFGVLGYGYEYLTGSDLGDDIAAGGQYIYDAGGQLVARPARSRYGFGNPRNNRRYLRCRRPARGRFHHVCG
jgi:hypothetical protein